MPAIKGRTQTLRVGYIGLPFTPDPLTASTLVERELLALRYDRLLEPTHDASRFKKGRLLESYRPLAGFREDDSGARAIEYEFKLHPSAAFSDGTAITAGDVAAAVEAMRETDQYEFGRYFVGAVAVDTQSFRIRLREHPAPERLLAFPIAFKKSKGRLTGSRFSEKPTAPDDTHIDKRSSREAVDLALATSIPTSSDGNIGRIILRHFAGAETSAAVEELNRGSIDMLLGIPPANSEFSRIDADRFQIRELSSNTVWVLAFNFQSPVFSSRQARRAVQLSIDTSEIDRDRQNALPGMNGPVIPTSGPFPPGSKANDPALRARPRNSVVAKSLTASMGKLDDKPLVLLVPYPDARLKEIADRIARSLTEVGFRVTVEVSPQWLPRGIPDKTRRFDLLLYRVEHDLSLSHLASLFDPAGPSLSHSKTNFLGYAPAALQQLFVDLRREQDADGIIRIRHRIHRYLQNDIAVIPLWCESTLAIWSKRVAGPAPPPVRPDSEGVGPPLFQDIENWKLDSPRT